MTSTCVEGAGVARRRSPRLHPQIGSREEGARMALRRSPRLHPRFQATAEGAGVARRRSSRLHPEIQASEEGARVTRRRRRGTSPPAAASLPDIDDLLREILLRLPPQPSSLPRASAVCKRWLGLVTDPKFTRRFRVHHRKPPLLGVFEHTNQGTKFNPILDPPDRIPPVRFSLGRYSSGIDYYVLNCRHGLVLLHDWVRAEVVVCDPIAGKQTHVAIPPEFRTDNFGGAVLCAASELGHVHGGCPFKVVLVSTDESPALACVYSSETGSWSNLISTEAPCGLSDVRATLVGNALYWLSEGDRMLEFDLDGQSLDVIPGPPDATHSLYESHQIIQGEDGHVGFAMLCFPRLQTWQRKVNCHGVATWVPWKTIEMHTILGLRSPIMRVFGRLLGYDEDNGVIFLYVEAGVYTVQLMSMQSRKLYETHCIDDRHPFTSFFTPGMDIAGS